MTDIIKLFNNISNESRTNKKVQLLKAFQNQSFLKQVLIYAYSNKEIFGITSKSIKQPFVGFNKIIPIETFKTLKGISGRNNKLSCIREALNGCSRDVITYFKRILDKDLNIGINKKLINKSFGEEIIPDFQKMLAFKQEEKRINIAFSDLKWCYYNIKVDGVRAVVYVNDEKNIEFYSRDGLPLQPFLTERIREEIVKNIDIFGGCILDAEISSTHFQKLMRIVNRKNVNMESIYIRNSCKLSIFDIIHHSDKELYKRVKIMQEIDSNLSSNVIKFLKYFKVKMDYKLISAIARKYIDLGAEGIIIKNPNSLYESKRSNNWLKFKDKNTIDLRIIGYYEGEEDTHFKGMLGGFIFKYKNNELRCGSGFSEDERSTFWNCKDELIGKMVELSYMEATKTGSLRHPVFERFRDDKENPDE